MRRSFTLIELIFAIIVISIAMLAIPPLFRQLTSQTQESLKSEAVLQSYRTILSILTYAWDENSPSPDTNRSYILDVTNGDNELDRNGASRFRRADFGQKASRKFFQNATYATTTLGPEGGDEDDIDDFDGKVEHITKEAGDILLDMNLTTKVNYISDSANYSSSTIAFTIPTASAAASTNIKLIEVNATSTDGDLVVLRAFSCNVGEPRLESKELP